MPRNEPGFTIAYKGITLISGVAFIAAAVGYLVVSGFDPTQGKHNLLDLVKELLLVIAVIMGVHLLERGLLWRDVASRVHDVVLDVLRSQNELAAGSGVCGIVKLWPARGLSANANKTTALQTEILRSVRDAKKRVWLLGVALGEHVTLADVLPLLKDLLAERTKTGNGREAKNPVPDVRVLLLEPHGTAGFFRSFLECQPESAMKLVTQRSARDNVYFESLLYVRFLEVMALLKQYPEVQAKVKFYANGPTCWLVIIDDSAYFEPYTFGRATAEMRTSSCVGTVMPVWKFERMNTTPSYAVFEILQDHFETVWKAANITYEDEVSRHQGREAILNEVLNRRSNWLDHVARSFFEIDSSQINARESQNAGG